MAIKVNSQKTEQLVRHHAGTRQCMHRRMLEAQLQSHLTLAMQLVRYHQSSGVDGSMSQLTRYTTTR